MSKSGWRGEKHRHSLASRGISTKKLPKINIKNKRFVVVDIDGTIFNVTQRWQEAKKVAKEGTPKFWDEFMNPQHVKLDKPIVNTSERLQELKSLGVNIIYLSGRRSNLLRETNILLKKHGYPSGRVILRPKGMDTTLFKVNILEKLKNNNEVLAYVGDEIRDKKISKEADVPLVRVRANQKWSSGNVNKLKRLIQND